MMPDYATRQHLIDRILQLQDIKAEPDDDKKLRKLILNVVLDHYSGSRLGVLDLQAIVDRLFHAMRGLDVLQPLMDDPAVTEIMVNGPHQVFIEMSGRITPSPLQFDHADHLAGMISRYFGQANRLINEKEPIASLRLPDGCRVHAVLPPVAPEGPVLSIRKFTGVRPELPELVQVGFLSQAEADYLSAAVKARQNLFISGGTGTGKTTFLNALSASIPRQERVITIEDSAELDLKDLPNRVRLESRQPGPDQRGAISLSALIQSALRMRPDRILVGEVRGAEVFAMLQAMNTGHPGSMSTGHANSALEMLERLGLMVLMEIHLPWDAIVRLVSSALQLIVHLERSPEGIRRVNQICRVKAGSGSGFELEPVSVSSWQERSIHGV